LKITMARRVKLIGEKRLHAASTKFTRRQAYIVNDQEVNGNTVRARIKIRGRALHRGYKISINNIAILAAILAQIDWNHRGYPFHSSLL